MIETRGVIDVELWRTEGGPERVLAGKIMPFDEGKSLHGIPDMN